METLWPVARRIRVCPRPPSKIPRQKSCCIPVEHLHVDFIKDGPRAKVSSWNSCHCMHAGGPLASEEKAPKDVRLATSLPHNGTFPGSGRVGATHQVQVYVPQWVTLRFTHSASDLWPDFETVPAQLITRADPGPERRAFTTTIARRRLREPSWRPFGHNVSCRPQGKPGLPTFLARRKAGMLGLPVRGGRDSRGEE